MQLSGGDLAFIVLLGIGAAVLGYALAERDRRLLGRTPWGMPALAWAVIWFMSWLVGLVLYLVAHTAEQRRVRAATFAGHGPAPTGRRAGVGPPPAPPGAPTAAVAPPAWHPDPSGRFEYRWWTGTEWTSHVATGGRMLVDTSPDQRIGPY